MKFLHGDSFFKIDKLAALAVFFIIGASNSLGKQPARLEFKGLEIRSAVLPAQVEQALGVKCGDGLNGAIICNGRSSIAERKGDINALISKEGRLERIRITVHSNDYSHVMSSLTKKFSTPDKTSQDGAQNGFGALLEDEKKIWLGKNGTQLSIHKYAGNTETCVIYFSTEEDRARLRRPATLSDL
ncbi:hypothetical protein E2K99_21735 [Herbaspirillum huttiense]|uniref:hypothetical protein n=1 Tax=Herbaspirillum TaxID=963 RepID=UPI0010662744|nr:MULTISPECIES: hypothetical protein [Herbaspirillum]QBP77446.1 hypothetical protein E2K99_21735 [Herbaspirillum huttiense]QNB09242.1 hypothetical protein G5S34_22470 [Herbaspirillum frisingense]